MSASNFPCILVIRTGAIGDTIVMSVVYQALRRQYPSAYIEAVGHVERLQLINTPALINNITSIDSPGFADLYDENAKFSRQLVTYVQQFDIIILYSFDPGNILTNNLRKISANQGYRFDPFPPEDANIHVTTYLLKTLERLGIDVAGLFPEIAIPKTGNSLSYSEGLRVAIHPGSGKPEKNWQAENFAELCARVIKVYQAKIVLIAGPAETGMLQAIAKDIPENSLRILHNLPLRTIAAELQGCHIYIGNDSGISHLAAALGVPTIAIFGPSNPQVWRPLGNHVIVLQGEPRPYCAGVSIEQVFAAVCQSVNLPKFS
jgi:ADP-heptose:LPS heptosyltransferase